MRNIIILIALFWSCVSSAEDLWYEFSLNWYQPIPYPINMSARVLDAPAGKHGHVIAVSDKLQFADGTPARFWGVGITVSNSAYNGGLPPEKKDAPLVADKLASYGFNHVRISGFDGRAPEAIKTWLQTGKIKSNQIDRLDYFISELRKRGIYYSLLINNTSHKLFEYSKAIPENNGEKYAFRHYYNTRLFSPDSVKMIAAWTRDFFERVNPYTGISYSSDPANIYVTTVNEDTAYLVNFSKGKRYDERWRNLIDSYFSDYLSVKYKSDTELSKSWSILGMPGLLPGESLPLRNVQVNPAIPASLLSKQRVSDLRGYLNSVDSKFYSDIKDSLRASGFKGLVSGTNKWYGYNNLYSNYLVGDFINSHAYFGMINKSRSSNGIKKSFDEFALTNQSYIDRLVNDPESALSDTRFALNRILPSHLIDRPFIVSEWNHMIWSDYAYEGPYLLSVYASLNGIDGLNIHTMYNSKKSNYKDNYPMNVYSVVGNPLLMAVLPTLSLAYLRGDISEIERKNIYCVADTLDDILMMNNRPHVPKDLIQLYKNSDFGSVRVKMLGKCINAHEKTGPTSLSSAVTLHRTKSGKGRVVVSTKKYMAVFGDIEDSTELDSLSTSISDPGSVSLVSLDGKDLSDSECALLTVASKTKNSNMEISYSLGRKEFKSLGHYPPLLRGINGTVDIKLANSSKLKVVPIYLNDTKSKQSLDINRDNDFIRLHINYQKTPWYVLTSNGCA